MSQQFFRLLKFQNSLAGSGKIPFRNFQAYRGQKVQRIQYSSMNQATRTVSSTLKFATAAAVTVLGLAYIFDSRAQIHRYVIMPLIRTVLDGEDSHKLAIWLAKHGLVPKESAINTKNDYPELKVTVWGKTLQNPIGLAAGFDKNGEAIDAMFGLGYGSVEIGSVTPEPQLGNPIPRVFRLSKDKAIINRYGFNSDGHAAVESRLRARVRRYLSSHSISSKSAQESNNEEDKWPIPGIPRSLIPGKLLGINLGKNKNSLPDSNEDYIKGVKSLGPWADYLVINISSPNTPGLRALQKRETLEKLLTEVMDARNTCLSHRPPLLVKIAPDLSDDDIKDIADTIVKTKVDGVIIGNTTVSRPKTLQSDRIYIREIGGLSGPPLHSLAVNTFKKLRVATPSHLTLIGCGGISSADDALDFEKAGADLIQLYTAMAWDGVGAPHDIKEGIAQRLRNEGRRWGQLKENRIEIKTE